MKLLKKNIAALMLLFSIVVLSPSCTLMLDILDASTTPSTNTTTDDNNTTTDDETTPKKGKTQGGGR